MQHLYYPSKLTDKEWDFLNWLVKWNGMECWCEFRMTEYPYEEGDIDYVYDLDEGRDINLHDAIETIAEGLVNDDVLEYDDGKSIWNGLMEKFSLTNYKI